MAHTILIVDDDAPTRKQLSKLLSEQSVEVVHAEGWLAKPINHEVVLRLTKGLLGQK